MSGEIRGAAAVIVASPGWPDAGGTDGGTGDTRGASFASPCPVGGAGGCGDTTGASGTASAGAAGTASGVAGDELSTLVSPRAVLSRCHRSGRTAWGSLVPASGDMTSVMYWVNVETSRSRVLGSQSLSGVLRTAQAWELSWGNASGVKGLSPWLRNGGRFAAAGRCWRRAASRCASRGGGSNGAGRAARGRFGTGKRVVAGACESGASGWWRPVCGTAGRRRVPARVMPRTMTLRTAPPTRRRRRAPTPWWDWEGRPAM